MEAFQPNNEAELESQRKLQLLAGLKLKLSGKKDSHKYLTEQFKVNLNQKYYLFVANLSI